VETPELSWTCPSCGWAATTRYCGSCGEEGIGALAPATDRSAAPAHSFVGRMSASLRALASPPGRLTIDWIRGRRVGYISPLSLFLWINVAFFIAQSASGLGILTWPLRVHLTDDSIGWLTTRLLAWYRPDYAAKFAANHAMAGDVYASVFDTLEGVHAKSLVIVMVPPFALALCVLLLDRRESLRNSLTFALHFFAFTLIWLCALFPTLAIILRYLVPRAMLLQWHSLDLVVSSVEAAVLGWFLFVALGTVYNLSRVRRLLMVVALIVALFGILKAYHVVVFAATLYSI
jgi:Protein of unknown function (DUF3667)